MIPRYLTLLPLAFFALMCQSLPDDGRPREALRIRIASEPSHLNPMLSAQTTARQIERNIFCPLEEYHPFTLALEPVLLKAKPQITFLDEGEHAGGTRFDMEIMEAATWDDGKAVTGYDYLFTMKLALNPYLSHTNWADQIEIYADIIIDPAQPKKITVFTNEQYVLGEDVVCGFPVYPAHIYDSSQSMADVDFATLLDYQAEANPTLDERLKAYADQFNDPNFSRKVVAGCGPYRLVDWSPGQRISLEKKEDWWGADLAERHPILVAGPSRLDYYIIPDEQTALTSLKDGRIDIVSTISPEQFSALEAYNERENTLSLTASPVFQYYYIAFNNQHPILSDVNVRTALSHLMNIDELIQQLFGGLAVRTVGPIHPSKQQYNHQVEPIPYDPMTAESLLRESGWTDQNGDGVLDKAISGQIRPLSLKIYTTRSQLSQDVAILLQQSARQVGSRLRSYPMIFESRYRRCERETMTWLPWAPPSHQA